MKRKTNPDRLRDMNQESALAYCANLTEPIWGVAGLDHDGVVELWRVFRAYIINGFKETGTQVPATIRAVWNRCKDLIDREARK